jgi:hypothetical protein
MLPVQVCDIFSIAEAGLLSSGFIEKLTRTQLIVVCKGNPIDMTQIKSLEYTSIASSSSFDDAEGSSDEDSTKRRQRVLQHPHNGFRFVWIAILALVLIVTAILSCWYYVAWNFLGNDVSGSESTFLAEKSDSITTTSSKVHPPKTSCDSVTPIAYLTIGHSMLDKPFVRLAIRILWV